MEKRGTAQAQPWRLTSSYAYQLKNFSKAGGAYFANHSCPSQPFIDIACMRSSALPNVLMSCCVTYLYSVSCRRRGTSHLLPPIPNSVHYLVVAKYRYYFPTYTRCLASKLPHQSVNAAGMSSPIHNVSCLDEDVGPANPVVVVVNELGIAHHPLCIIKI
jgi:hypothetical protein